MTKQVIVMRTDLNMRKGKMAAQAAHASLGVFTQTLSPGIVEDSYMFSAPWDVCWDWFNNSYTKICVGIGSEEELVNIFNQAKEADILCKLITDNGKTEFNGVPTRTCCAIGPDFAEKIDKITGHLKLL